MALVTTLSYHPNLALSPIPSPPLPTPTPGSDILISTDTAERPEVGILMYFLNVCCASTTMLWFLKPSILE